MYSPMNTHFEVKGTSTYDVCKVCLIPLIPSVTPFENFPLKVSLSHFSLTNATSTNNDVTCGRPLSIAWLIRLLLTPKRGVLFETFKI